MDPQTSPVCGSPTLRWGLVSAAPDSLDTAITAAQAASDKLATDIVAIDVSEQLVITDVFVICSGANERQVKSIVDAIEEALHAKGVKPIRREGVKGRTGCCWTSVMSSCTCNRRRIASTTRSNAYGRTALSSNYRSL